MRNTLEWLLYESTTILAYNSNMAARLVSEGPLKYENGHNSSIFEARSQTLASVDIFRAVRNTLEWLLCKSNTTLAYNSKIAARLDFQGPLKYENRLNSSIFDT